MSANRPAPLHRRLFRNLTSAALAASWPFEEIIRRRSLVSGDLIQNAIERNFSFGVAPFASRNLKFDPGNGALADYDDVTWRVEEVVEHAGDANPQVCFLQYPLDEQVQLPAQCAVVFSRTQKGALSGGTTGAVHRTFTSCLKKPVRVPGRCDVR